MSQINVDIQKINSQSRKRKRSSLHDEDEHLKKQPRNITVTNSNTRLRILKNTSKPQIVPKSIMRQKIRKTRSRISLEQKDNISNNNHEKSNPYKYIEIKTELQDDTSLLDNNAMFCESSEYFICDNNTLNSQTQIKSEVEDDIFSLLETELEQDSKSLESDKFGKFNNERLFHCNDCDYQTTRKLQIGLHIQKYHSDEPKENEKMHCSNCGKTFKTIQATRQHMSLCGKFNYVCTLCGKEAKFSHMMKAHLENKHMNEIKPEEFDPLYRGILNQRKKLRAEALKLINVEEDVKKKRVHAQDELVKSHCVPCKKTFDRIRHNNRVLKKCPECKTLLHSKCVKCGKVLSPEYITKHLRIVCFPRRYYKCDDCDYVATWRWHMQCHKKVKHSGLPKSRNDQSGKKMKYFCERCDFKTPYKFNLQAHVLNEHRDTEYELEKEENILDNKSFLNIFNIPESNDANISSIEIPDQLKTIRAWKTFKCSHCSYTAPGKSQIQSHIINKHAKEFNELGIATCPMCDRQFRRLHALKKHKLVCGLVNYKCLYCSECWTKSSAVKYHLRGKHADIIRLENVEEVYDEILKRATELRDIVNKTVSTKQIVKNDKENRLFKIQDGMIKLYCETCNESFPRIRERGNAFMKNCSRCQTKLQSQCTKCSKLYPSARHIWTHITLCYRDRENFRKTKLKILDDGGEKTWSETMYCCDYCGFTSKEKTELRWHILSRHMEIRLYECEHCNFKSPYRPSFLYHIGKMH